jgi:hypothetical protein
MRDAVGGRCKPNVTMLSCGGVCRRRPRPPKPDNHEKDVRVAAVVSAISIPTWRANEERWLREEDQRPRFEPATRHAQGSRSRALSPDVFCLIEATSIVNGAPAVLSCKRGEPAAHRPGRDRAECHELLSSAPSISPPRDRREDIDRCHQRSAQRSRCCGRARLWPFIRMPSTWFAMN